MIIKKLDPLERYEIEMLNGKKVEFVITESTPEYLRFESRNCLGEYVPMTAMNDWLEKQFSLLPDELKAVIIPTERVHRDRNGEVHKETVKLFLPSASEIFTDYECSYNADKGLYEQLDYYKDPNNRVRTFKDGDSDTDLYWISTPLEIGSDYWHIFDEGVDWLFVDRDGYADAYLAPVTCEGAPICFRIEKARLQELFQTEMREENDT